MTKADITAFFGHEGTPVQSMMTSCRWECSQCHRITDHDVPVKPPAPCICGSIFFTKRGATC